MHFTDPRLKKIYFRCCYRGKRETEMLLAPFALSHLASFNADQLDHFEHILAQSDADIHAWIISGEKPPKTINGSMIDHLRHHTLGHGKAKDAISSH